MLVITMKVSIDVAKKQMHGDCEYLLDLTMTILERELCHIVYTAGN